MGRRDEGREELRLRLLETAERHIAAQGLAGLKARELTAEAGVALGSIYNAFENLDLLVVHVNARTLARLDAALREMAPDTLAPAERMVALARGYVRFALDNRRLWAALFDHRLPEHVAVPEWHREAHVRILQLIAGPLARLRPDLSVEQLALRARTLFAAVHGVVHLSSPASSSARPGRCSRRRS
ncbi:putative transcriptional regulator protein, TetR family [Rubellimicrobium mesophilum DSM 19309]|uniref:Putative transcriptional regulator protein, TetR family n=1 Tax=Rubellimicrobium mesophilum DSM 19309 TaxID=442562 RepID=A0A017HNU5_9RHOB|nr:TetR/AcrR family transcriptional regulator [Rubellimicrobium mesophilum]EYD75980.1 putative transcriptional regulator protein, TetR family [Rubellimicrobium mesophilum DSM 19309]